MLALILFIIWESCYTQNYTDCYHRFEVANNYYTIEFSRNETVKISKGIGFTKSYLGNYVNNKGFIEISNIKLEGNNYSKSD